MKRSELKAIVKECIEEAKGTSTSANNEIQPHVDTYLNSVFKEISACSKKITRLHVNATKNVDAQAFEKVLHAFMKDYRSNAMYDLVKGQF